MRPLETPEFSGGAVEKAIAECAEQILRVLRERGEVNVLRLPEYLGLRSTITYQGLGWLAREGRVRYMASASQLSVSTRHQEPPDSTPAARRTT